jgi:hypothetical protein
VSREEKLENMLQTKSANLVMAVVAMLAIGGCGDPPEAKVPVAEPSASTPAPTAPPATTAMATGTAAAVVEAPPPRQAIEETKIVSFERSPESLKIDKVGVADGALTPDGQKDIVFTLKLSGPIESVYITSIDAKTGATTGEFQGDTLTGTTIQPNEFAALRAGGRTVGIGVMEGDKLVNKPDGSLPALPGGAHTYTLILANSPSLKAGKPIGVFVQTPDHQVVKGPIVTK